MSAPVKRASFGATGGPSKKTKNDDDEVPSSFLRDLEGMDTEPDAPESMTAKWRRPPVPSMNSLTDSFVFQQLEMDHYLGDPMLGMPGSSNGPVPIMRMFGVTEAGNSVVLNAHGFAPYFYCPAPAGFRDIHVVSFKTALNQRALGNLHGAKDTQEVVLAVEMVMKESIKGFHGNQKSMFLQITVGQHKLISACKRALEDGIAIPDIGFRAYECYETNIEYNMRFMVDTSVMGCSWIECKPGTYRIRSAKDCVSNCQIEVDVAWDAFISHQPDTPEWSKVAPLRILSFDIECAGRQGIFPEPEIDPVIQIANMVTLQGAAVPFVRNVFTLNTCASIVNAQVLSFKKEGDLLAAWTDFFTQVDADIVTGYNINNFDLPYLVNRAKSLKVTSFPFLTRIKSMLSKISDTKFSSKAYGARENKSVNMDGRVPFDMIQVLQRDYKLRSYSLNSVSAHFLNEQKEDVHHSIITDLQNGTDQTRRRLAVYCMKDAYLPLRLMSKLMCVYNYMEMARVTGVPFSYLLARGQQIKVLSKLLRCTREQDLVLPVHSASGGDSGEQYEGATVIEPKKGFYDQPIATLDFASLYPSIMMAHNLCYTTLLSKAEREKYSPDDYIKTPTGDYFVKASVRPGLLPKILKDLLAARKVAKAALKNETDPFKRAVLDGRQLALKISCNSVYGFTGATVGKLPCLEISASTTAFGRQMIEATKELVQKRYTIANGFTHNAEVIYGDTDSVMIKFGSLDLKEVMATAKEAAAFVTESFVRPISLEFEKVYFPYLLINKKRYAGLYWTNPDKYDKMDCKGIVTVRRDNCPLVVTLINTCLQKLLIERDIPSAIDYAKGVISDLLCNRVDISQLVITKALSKAKEDYAGKQAHVELAERMRKRDAGSAPTLGDRVAYVIIQGRKNAPAFEKSEDPIYVLDNSIPIDTTYYLENQLSNPLMSIFEPVMGEVKAKTLLSGDHTRTVVKTTSTTGALMKFATKQETCLGCKALLKASEKTICTNCKPHESNFYQKEIAKIIELENKFSRLWSQCQRCQESLHQEVLCTSADCPIFYMRKKVQKDLKDQDVVLQRFDTSW